MEITRRQARAAATVSAPHPRYALDHVRLASEGDRTFVEATDGVMILRAYETLDNTPEEPVLLHAESLNGAVRPLRRISDEFEPISVETNGKEAHLQHRLGGHVVPLLDEHGRPYPPTAQVWAEGTGNGRAKDDRLVAFSVDRLERLAVALKRAGVEAVQFQVPKYPHQATAFRSCDTASRDRVRGAIMPFNVEHQR